MCIRTIYRYQVIKRFCFGKKMFAIAETIYIQEQDLEDGNPQKVFGQEKEYLADISSEIYESLCNEFIVRDDNCPLNQNKS